MPLKKCQKDGKGGWKWGDSGACHTGKDGREKARKQGIAIELSKKRRGEKSEFDKAFTKEEQEAAIAEYELEKHFLDKLNG